MSLLLACVAWLCNPASSFHNTKTTQFDLSACISLAQAPIPVRWALTIIRLAAHLTIFSFQSARWTWLKFDSILFLASGKEVCVRTQDTDKTTTIVKMDRKQLLNGLSFAKHDRHVVLARLWAKLDEFCHQLALELMKLISKTIRRLATVAWSLISVKMAPWDSVNLAPILVQLEIH